MSEPLRDLATTRLASLCLKGRGQPRGLTFDDHLVRGALIVDLALCEALSHDGNVVEMDHGTAAAHGLAEPARQADEGDGSLLEWLDWGELGFDEWAGALVDAGIWRVRRRRPWYPWRRFDDSARDRATADRRAGRQDVHTGAETPQTCAVLALGSTSGFFGRSSGFFAQVIDLPEWTLEGLGEARWAAELVVERLTELRIRMRAIGHAVD